MGRFFGLIRLFFRHFFRDVVVSVIIAAIVGVLTLLVGVLLDLLFNDLLGLFEVMTVNGLMITAAVVGLAGSFIGMGLASDREYYGACYLKGAKAPHLSQVRFVLFVLFLLLSVGGAAFLFIGWQWLTELVLKNEWLILIPVCVLSIVISQLFYFVFCSQTYKLLACRKCKHVFCVEREESTLASWDTYHYTDTTKRENIGSIGSTQVYADVTRRKYFTRRHRTYHYHCKCHYCGDEYEGEGQT